MSYEQQQVETLEVLTKPITAADYVQGIDAYLADAEKNNILRPHQDVIFHDIQDFLRDGGTKGYVTSPTGTGKTVLFVELSKALQEAGQTAGRSPRILVVEPTKDLVHQTLGRKGKKGYGEFAPGLRVASFFSDSVAEDKLHLNRADVVVTTYDSLPIMTRREEMRDQTGEEKEQSLQEILGEYVTNGRVGSGLYDDLEVIDDAVRKMGKVGTGRTLFDFFDVVIFDEAHHVMGDTMASLVESVGEEKIIIGFTATPDANEKKRLDAHLPVKIHDLTFKEAIAMELLAPVTGIGLHSHVKVQGSDLLDREGDYQEGKLAYLANSNSRNQLILQAAQTLVEHGFATLIPCIPGANALHARNIASELSRMGVSAAAIYGGITTRQRNNIYERFEAGEIDVLTNIRILGEGWDSTRAKGIVEASPTRSLIIKRQRDGRIVRPGDIAVVLEILDDYDTLNPPLYLADILDGTPLETGEIYGNATDEQRQRVAGLIKDLRQHATVVDQIPADYSAFFDTLSQYQEIVGGRVRSHKAGHYSIPEKISPQYTGITDAIMVKLWQRKQKEPDVVLGRQHYTIRMLYDVGQSMQMLREIPKSEKDKAYIEEDERWLAAEGFVIGFAQKYPGLDVAFMQERLRELESTLVWRPLKRPLPITSLNQRAEYEVFKAYRADPETIKTLSQQLEDYFDIMQEAEIK